MKKKLIIISSSIMGFILLCLGIMLIYFSIYYRADINNDILKSNEYVMVVNHKDYLMFEPKKEYKAAFIFYQGAKVDETAYAPLIKDIASYGILCFIVKVPLNFAIFDINAAKDIIEKYRDKNLNWYIGGHSLGGAMASIFASENDEIINGVILLASYSTKDLTNLNVLSIYGTNDEILNIDKYIDNKINLPDNFIEFKIEGGNHAYFGYYGEQKGDGESMISREEQINKTVLECINFILYKEN